MWMTMDNFVTAFRIVHIDEIEALGSWLVTRPPKRMMLEIAVDKRNSFRLNFCQAKLVQLTLLVEHHAQLRFKNISPFHLISYLKWLFGMNLLSRRLLKSDTTHSSEFQG